MAAKRAVCFGGHGDRLSAPCSFSNIPWMVFFGALNIMCGLLLSASLVCSAKKISLGMLESCKTIIRAMLPEALQSARVDNIEHKSWLALPTERATLIETLETFCEELRCSCSSFLISACRHNGAHLMACLVGADSPRFQILVISGGCHTLQPP